MVFVPYLGKIDLSELNKTELRALEKRLNAELAVSKVKIEELQKAIGKVKTALGKK